MADYRVNLDIFAGPLDLLLYLVRKEEVDIYDIPIAKITQQYLGYVEIIKQFDIDLAGTFLVMAATLMEIKSAMLLPQAEPGAIDSDDASDPRSELIRQLLEYKKFKDAANLLGAAAEYQKERFARPANLADRLVPDAEPEIDMDQVSIWDLLEAFDTVCKATGSSTYTGHITDDTPIDLYQIEILHRLQTDGPITFNRIFESRPNRLVMVGLFLALLELVRDKLIWAEQSDSPPQIYLRALTDEPAEQAVQRAILVVDEGDSAISLQAEPAEPPIPIAELPPKPRTGTPTPQPDPDAQDVGQQVESTEDTSEEAETVTPAPQTDGPTAPQAERPHELPIPIVELPSKGKSRPRERQHEQTAEMADNDDLVFDKP